MANEFIARKGLIVSGATVTTGQITATSFSGAGTGLTGTAASLSVLSASYALTASHVPGVSGLTGGTANYIPLWTSATAQSSSNIYQSSGNIGIGTATPTAKLAVNGNTDITGSLIVTDRITAQEFHTEFVSSSIIYQSGSTKFGDTSDDVMSVTGSLRVSGTVTASVGMLINGNTVWHAGNDGAGSGLDADLLDGQTGTYYTTAGNLSGTIPSSVLGNSTLYVGTTAIALNRASTSQTLTGVSIDGNSATVSNITRSNSGGADLNTLTTSGFYRVNNTESNRPGDWGQLLTVYGGSDTITQIYGDYSSGTLYTRSGNPSNVGGSGAWTAWRTVLQSNNYNNYSPTLTGTGASGTWSISVTGTATNITAYTINQNLGTSNTPTFNYVIFKDSNNANTYGFRGLSGVITCDGGAQYPTAWNFQYGNTSTSAMYITSSGNVGIGTTNPGNKLHVLGSNTIATLESSTGYMDILLKNSTNTNGFIQYNGPDLRFYANSGTTPTLIIKGGSPGNVGIGTTTPSQQLTVVDTLAITNTAGAQYLLMGNQDSSGVNNPSMIQAANGAIAFGGGTSWSGAGGTFTATMHLTDGGNVGIGTTNPSTKLHLYEAGAADAIFRITPANTTYDSVIQLTGQGNDITVEGFEIWYDNDVGDVHLATTFANDAATIHFHTRTGASKSTSNERMTILGNGNVGIGTTSPAQKLQVIGNAIIGANSNSSVAARLDITAGGNGYDALIDFGYYDTFDAGIWNIGRKGSSGAFFISNFSSGPEINVVTINTSLNVGIGTTTPNQKLSINGNSNITGSLDVTGAFTAQTKSFKIDHQKLPSKSLVYGVLEGPEHAVYARGKLTNNNVIQLPEEWEWLVDETSITVQLTPIGSHQQLYVETIENNQVVIQGDSINCFYLAHATRKDVESLDTVQ